MKSGLEGRNNKKETTSWPVETKCLNEVRPRRPEQYGWGDFEDAIRSHVSMKSGLEGRNNPRPMRVLVAQCPVSMKSGLEGRNN